MTIHDYGDYSEETRAVYHKQHLRIAKDKRAMKRFIGMFSNEYFGLSHDYFKGRKILDAGCGDTAKVMIGLYKLGARDIHGIDLGEEFIPVAESSLKTNGVPLDLINLKTASVLEIPYEDNHFDFVVCHGVLLHLNNIDEVEIAFSELARVTKPGGYLYTVYGIVGGLFEDAIIPAIRKYYTKDHRFKNFIDNVSPEDFAQVFDTIMKGINHYQGETIDLEFLKTLLDVDFCVFLQNLIQAPVRLPISENLIRDLYSKNGIKNLRRLKRYVKRENIRKFVAPLHYDIEHPISKLLYGSGNLEFIGEKG